MKIKTLSSCIITFVFAIFVFCGCDRPETYIVTFNANGGYGTMQQQVFTEGEQQALNRNAFTREGYSFSGWNGNGVNYIDGQVITITSDMTLYALWTSNGGQQGGGSSGGSGGGNQTGNQLNGHEYVDLGLPSGTLWATCNVGANIPSGTGYYYAWGETTPKSEYTSDNYTYTEISPTLPASADAATINWGNGWRMPTQEEMEELKNSCIATWTTMNDVKGCLFTGPSGYSIFLPASGNGTNTEMYPEGPYGDYWSSTVLSNYYASTLYFDEYHDNVGVSISENLRRKGLSVRPVVAQ